MDPAEESTQGSDDGDEASPGEDEVSEPFERVRARGHENVRGAHESTLEVTTDDWLTPAGDCILAVGADRTPADFDPAFVEACRASTATITATLRVYRDDGDEPTATTTVRGRGHPDLTLDSDRSAVCRTSEYVDDRTVMVDADRAAADLDRDLVDLLTAADARLEMTLSVEP